MFKSTNHVLHCLPSKFPTICVSGLFLQHLRMLLTETGLAECFLLSCVLHVLTASSLILKNDNNAVNDFVLRNLLTISHSLTAQLFVKCETVEHAYKICYFMA
jgi:hypothetical protein